jgi:hypothetical protein
MLGPMTRDAAAWYMRRAEFAFPRWSGLTGEAKRLALADANAQFAALYPPPAELGIVTDSVDAPATTTSSDGRTCTPTTQRRRHARSSHDSG